MNFSAIYTFSVDSVLISNCLLCVFSDTIWHLAVQMKVGCPTMNFSGRIIYSRTYHEVEKAAKELLEIIEAKKQSMDNISLGFDIEWRPTFKRGDPPLLKMRFWHSSFALTTQFG